MALSEKRRILDKQTITSTRATYSPALQKYVTGPITKTWDIYSTQITRSEGHPWPKAKGVRDVGGPFDSVKLVYTNNHAGQTFSADRNHTSPYTYEVRGSSQPQEAGMPSVFLTDSTTHEGAQYWIHNGTYGTDLLPVGAKYVASTIPTNPTVDGAVSLAELYREGIPSMVGASFLKDRASFMKSLGGEYLNYQFGWAPLVSSLKDAAKAVMESHEILQQLARDSGKNVYRKRHSPVVTSTTVDHRNTVWPLGFSGTDTTAPPWFRVTDTTTSQTWFSGCYTYHYEPDKMNNLERIATQARLLYGIELSPDVLWNLAPWSWLIDWFVNVGPLISNVTAFQRDGLVLRYGYVMEKSTRTITRTNTISPQWWNGYPVVSQDKFEGIRKRRVKASPYGFGVNSSAFTSRQWTILAALGMTQGSRLL